MAVLWQKQIHNTNYRVVKAGASVRLYRNNVLHSQWNPANPVKGNLWELFLLSCLGTKKLKSVLVLGVGGGAVINLVHRFFPETAIDAVEMDKVHIIVAKKYFHINFANCHLIHADAFDWIKTCANRTYDLIIDDVFHESNRVPFRSIQMSADWINLLLKKLNTQGTLVINFADKKEWKFCRESLKVRKILNEKYQIGVAFNNRCENRVVHISARSLSANTIRKTLQTNNFKDYLRCWSEGMFSYRRIQ